MIFVDRIRSTQVSFEGYSFYHLRDECKPGNLMRHLLGRGCSSLFIPSMFMQSQLWGRKEPENGDGQKGAVRDG